MSYHSIEALGVAVAAAHGDRSQLEAVAAAAGMFKEVPSE